MSGITIHDGALVASGANSYLRDLGGFRSPNSTDFSESDSKLRESTCEFGGILQLSLIVL